jgi:hypothetical protein
MIPDDAFLRRIPANLDRTQTVYLEALVFSADTVRVSFNTIKNITGRFGKEICSAPSHARLELFIHAWTIIDRVHVVRELLLALDYATPKAVSFRETYEVATKLRNLMDHLKGNARNIADAKHRPPLFGALCYVFISNDNVEMKDRKLTVNGGHTIMVSAGHFQGVKR